MMKAWKDCVVKGRKAGWVFPLSAAVLIAWGTTALPTSSAQAQEKKAAPAVSQFVEPPNDEAIEHGRQVYFKRCVWCHGEKGDGDGPAALAERAFPRPRNFNTGTFKIRTTDSGELPTDADLIRTVKKGLTGSLMPPWEHILSEKDIHDVVQFVKYRLVLDKSFNDPDESFTPITDKDWKARVSPSKDSLSKGAEIYFKAGCFNCHGDHGRGDGNPTMQDDFGIVAFGKTFDRTPIMAADLRQCWRFRGAADSDRGAIADEVFREVSTGLNGTPMPSFRDTLKAEERWHVANFVIFLCGKTESFDEMLDWTKEAKEKLAAGEQSIPTALGTLSDKPNPDFSLGEGKIVTLKPKFAKVRVGQRPPLEGVIKSKFIKEDLPTTVDDPRWETAPPVHIRMGGQVSIEPREFTATIFTLTIRSLYNEKEITFRIDWNDRDESSPAKAQLAAFVNPVTNPKKLITPDALEIQFPADPSQLTGTEKPFWIAGDEKRPVNVWRWENGAGAKEFNAWGFKKTPEMPAAESTYQVQAGTQQALFSHGAYSKGQWRVMMKRPLTTTDKNDKGNPIDIQFQSGGAGAVGYGGGGGFIPIAFSAFDGSEGQKETERSISTWYFVLLEPPMPLTVYFYPPVAVILVVGFEWWLRRQAKKNNSI